MLMLCGILPTRGSLVKERARRALGIVPVGSPATPEVFADDWNFDQIRKACLLLDEADAFV